MNIQNKLVDTFQNRLNNAMRIRGFKQVDLAEKSNLSKQQISQYVHGKFQAKQNAVYALAKALDVAEAWLMGFDVPMEKEQPTQEKTELQTIAAHSNLPLTEKEMEKVLEFAKFIISQRGNEEQ